MATSTMSALQLGLVGYHG